MSFFQHLWIFCCGKPKSQKNIDEPYLPPKIIFYKKSEVSPQFFSIPKPYMYYLITNANVENIKKLQQTCRYFYSKFNFNIIDIFGSSFGRIVIKMCNFDIGIPDKKIHFFQNNLYLNKKVVMSGRCKFLKELFPKIIKCEISELVLEVCGIFTIDYFKILTKSGSVKTLKIRCNMYQSDNITKVPLEDILLYVPSVSEMINTSCLTTSETMAKLFLLKRNVKFCYLQLGWISDSLDPILFNNYIKEMFDFNARYVSFHPIPFIDLTGDENVLQQICELVKPWREHCTYYEIAEALIIK